MQEIQKLKTPQTSQTADYGVQGAVRMFVCASQHCGATGIHSIARQSLCAVTPSARTENLYGQAMPVHSVSSIYSHMSAAVSQMTDQICQLDVTPFEGSQMVS